MNNGSVSNQRLGKTIFILLLVVVSKGIWIILGLFFLLPAYAEVYIANPETYRERLVQLKPGDHLYLGPGEYKQGLPVHNLHGTEVAPIIISGEELPHTIFIGRQGHNTVSIVNSRYITIRNLVIDGQDLPVDGVKCEGHADWAHNITLDGLNIRGHGNDQQIVGISTKCPAWNWIIRNNTIIGAGTGIYLGDSDGSAAFFSGIVEHNLIVDTQGYNLQIKHQLSRPVMPVSGDNKPSETIIRHNVFAKTLRGQQGMERPNVLVGHWPLNGPGKDDRYLIYGNFFYQNTDESLFQGEGNIALYNNLFVNHDGDAIRIQPHHDVPRNISIFHNTILAAGVGIYFNRQTDNERYSQWIRGNAIFSSKPLVGLIDEKNILERYQAASDYLVNPFAQPGTMNLTPLMRQKQNISVDLALVYRYPDWNLDFDDKISKSRLGAYGYHKAYKWLPNLEMKPY